MFNAPCRGMADYFDVNRASTRGIRSPEPITIKGIPKLSTGKYLRLWITWKLGLRFRSTAAFIVFLQDQAANRIRPPEADDFSAPNTKMQGKLCRNTKARRRKHGSAPIFFVRLGHTKSIFAIGQLQNVFRISLSTASRFQSSTTHRPGRRNLTPPPDQTRSTLRSGMGRCYTAARHLSPAEHHKLPPFTERLKRPG